MPMLGEGIRTCQDLHTMVQRNVPVSSVRLATIIPRSHTLHLGRRLVRQGPGLDPINANAWRRILKHFKISKLWRYETYLPSPSRLKKSLPATGVRPSMGSATIMETQLRTASKLKPEICMFLRAMCHVVSKNTSEEPARRTYE